MANGRGCRPNYCRVCGQTDDVVGTVSFRFKCAPCAARLQTEAAMQMHAGVGPVADKWRERMIGALWPRLDVNPATGKRRQRKAS